MRLALLALAAAALGDEASETGRCVTRVWLESEAAHGASQAARPHELELDVADVRPGVEAFLQSIALSLTPERKAALAAAIFTHAASACFDRPRVTKRSALADLATCHAATAAEEPLVFVTVGAHHWFPPTRDATLHDVAEAHGWTGVLVEAAPRVFAELSRRRDAHPGGLKYWPVEAAACAATSNATFYAARGDMAERARDRSYGLRSWATETGSLSRNHVVTTLFGTELERESEISDTAADVRDRPDHFIEAYDVRCLGPTDLLEAGVAAGAPPSLAARGPALYYSDLEGADFPVVYVQEGAAAAAAAASTAPANLLLLSYAPLQTTTTTTTNVPTS